MTTAGLKRFFKRSSWIGKTNCYSKDVVARLKKASPSTKEHRRNLAQYIAASVALHGNDGWSYLGRAVGCILTGDIHRALHLAYYAELRAAMSLLAGFGVGIFDRQHFIVSHANSITKLRTPLGTHLMAWAALEEWAQLATSGDVFVEVVRPEGHNLDQWFYLQGGGRALAPQARDWFMQWGMDLRLASRDREARYESSYRPDGVPTVWEADASESLAFVQDMWRLLEPSGSSTFEQIDRHILRLSVESVFRGSTGKTTTEGDPHFEALVDRMLSRMNMTSSAEHRMKEFLCRQSSPDDPSLFHYSAVRPGNPKSDALAVISRAVLLLRLATGSAHRLLERTGIGSDDLAFWWGKLGESRGIWSPGNFPSELYDLWADIEDSLKSVADAEDENEGLFNSFNMISSSVATHLGVLASHERVGIWGLCPQ